MLELGKLVEERQSDARTHAPDASKLDLGYDRRSEGRGRVGDDHLASKNGLGHQRYIDR